MSVKEPLLVLPYTSQEALDLSYARLAAQGCKGRKTAATFSQTRCAYAGDNNTGCAIGVLIEDRAIAEELDKISAGSIRDLLRAGVVEAPNCNLDLLITMQRYHDIIISSDEEEFQDKIYTYYKMFASRFNLSTAALEPPK